jgi:hypothetical protein
MHEFRVNFPHARFRTCPIKRTFYQYKSYLHPALRTLPRLARMTRIRGKRKPRRDP